ncbi:hypothetical protein, partial [Pedobacter sp.]|uniref:hypothetical protein n=1 Tax=Pedobacter sp. TaxID=1411316 RepID=UPI003D7FF664
SLAATGKGHMTDVAILDILHQKTPAVNIIWEPKTFLPFHPNGMKYCAIKRCWHRHQSGNQTTRRRRDRKIYSPIQQITKCNRRTIKTLIKT